MNNKWRSANKNKLGFTLVELIVATLISTIVSGLIMDNFIRSLSQAKEDREKITTTFILTGIIQKIGNDIQVAGEQIPEDTFPAISFDSEPKIRNFYSFDSWSQRKSLISVRETNKIVIRRSILKSLTLCQQILSGTTIGDGRTGIATNGIAVATDDMTILESSCRTQPMQSSSTIIPALPQGLRDVRNYRCMSAIILNSDRLDGCHTSTSENNSHPIVSALISDRNGKYNTFSIYDEQSKSIPSGNQYDIFVTAKESSEGEAAITDYPIGSPIYIIEKREYVLDDKGNINLYINDVAVGSVASGIEKFTISAKLYADRIQKTVQATPANPCANQATSTCEFSSINGDRWKDIASIKIEIQKKYNSLGNNIVPTQSELQKLTASNEFSLLNIKN